MFMKNILLSSVLFIGMILNLFASIEAKDLSCSYNGTDIFFINGIFNGKSKATKTKRLIEEIYRSNSNNSKKIDNGYSKETAGIVKVKLIHNRSAFLFDIAELSIQIHSLDNDPDKYKKLSAHLFNTPLMSPEGKATYLISDVIQEISETTAEYYKRSIINIRDSDVIELSNKIKSSLEINKKVVLISHSQGNLFASEAYRILNNIYADESNPLQYFANMRIGSPYSDSSNIRKMNILVRQDKVINNILLPHPGVTHELKPLFYDENRIDKVISYFLSVKGSLAYKVIFKSAILEYGDGHGMPEIYLNNSVLGKTIGPTGAYKPMKEIFKEKMIKIAKELPSNCEKYVPSTIMLDREDTSEVVGNKKGGEENVLLSIDSSNVFPVGGEEDESKEADLTRFTGYIWSTNYARDPIETIDPELKYVIPENFDGILDKVTIRVQGVFEDGSVTEVSEKIIDIIPYCSKTGKYDPSLDKCIYDPPVAIGPTCISSELLPTANVNAGDRYFRDCSIEATIDCKGDPNCDTEFNCKGKTNCDPTFKRTDKNIQFTWHDYDETGSFAWYGWDGVSHKRNFTQSTYDSTVYKGNEIELCRCQF